VLTELRVRDLGVIEDLTVTFGPGMTVLTGETGAGKTLLVEALQLVVGGRADPALVRTGATEALVEARFRRVPDGPGDGTGAGGDAGEVIVARSVPAEGRSRAWIDGRMATATTLAEVTTGLLEIHGQHAHQALLTPAAQRAALDSFAGTDLSALTALRAEARGLHDALAALGGDPAQRAREADVLRYQVSEITAAALSDPDEDDELRRHEARLADATAFREAASAAHELLDPASNPDEGGVLALLGQAAAVLSGREAFDAPRAQIEAAALDLTEVAHTLRAEAEEWDDDPGRLAAVQERRRILADLRRKYGPALSDVLAFAESGTARLAELDDAEGAAARLAAEQEDLVRRTAEAEEVVRQVRAGAASRLGQLVGDQLAALAMAGARVEVNLAPGGTGEPVELALGANLGEAVLPLAKAASGGELARAMLAIRLVTLDGPHTMVFDEVDAGVGGAAALALGTALHEVARQRQVLVVTHLAQVAARADHQVSIAKSESGGRTLTAASAVEGEARVRELSRMLSGHPDSDAARAHARELLGV
jgi:DNA repair protein RecN (Recombination protein N)